MKHPEFNTTFGGRYLKQDLSEAFYLQKGTKAVVNYDWKMFSDKIENSEIAEYIRDSALKDNKERTAKTAGLINLKSCQEGFDETCENTLDEHIKAGWFHIGMGDYSKGRFHLEYVLLCKCKHVENMLFSGNETVLKGLMICAAKLGHYQKAVAYGHLLLTLASEQEHSQVWLDEAHEIFAALYLEMRDLDKADSYLKKLKFPNRFYYLALYHIIKNDFDNADVCAEQFKAKIISQPNSSADTLAKVYELNALVKSSRAGSFSRLASQADCLVLYSEAFKLFDEAMKHYASYIGVTHFDTGKCHVYRLSALINCLGSKESTEVVTCLKTALAFVERRCSEAYEIADDETRYNFLWICRHITSLCNSIVVRRPHLLKNEDVLCISLLMKNICTEASYLQISDLSDNRENYRHLYRKWLQLRDEFRQMAKLPFSELLYGQKYSQLFNLELSLTKAVIGLGAKDRLEAAAPAAVCKALDADTAILEFGSFYYTTGKYYENGKPSPIIGLPENGDATFEHYYYSALVHSGGVNVVYVGKCKKIDELVKQLRKRIVSCDDLSEVKLKLYKKLIYLSEANLEGKTCLKIAPDGNLSKMPFELLCDSYGKSLGERFSELSYISTARTLCNRAEKKSDLTSVSVFANPEFKIASSEVGFQRVGYVSMFNMRDAIDDLKPDKITQLPWTAAEAATIAEVCNESNLMVRRFEQREANVKNFRMHPSSIVHISTHGFALEQPSDEDMRPLGSDFSKNADPMKRCGIMFSGICNALERQMLPEDFGDGVLTGSDILSLDMSDTQLLVLSMCNSGLGEIQSGESLQGLKLAFEIAGVSSLICTLWSVDDFASAVLMSKFYSVLFSDENMTIAPALSEAKKYVRNISYGELRQLSEWSAFENYISNRMNAYEHSSDEIQPFSHPWYWAGFVVSGDVKNKN